MNVEKKRAKLMEAYPRSPRWEEKVKHMSEEQVVAIYLRLEAQGRFKGNPFNI